MALAIVLSVVTGGALTIGSPFQALFPSAPQLQLAMFHTVFNICTVILILPFTDELVTLVERIMPDKKVEDADAPRLHYLDENMLRTPVIAVGQLKQEVLHMADIAIDNFYRSLKMISTLDFAEREAFEKNENELNFLNAELARFIVALSGQKVSVKDTAYLNTTLRTVADLERIGDYAENIVEYADNLVKGGDALSEEAVGEVATLRDMIRELFDHAKRAYAEVSRKALEKADEVEDQIDLFTEKMAENHVRRMTEGSCTPNAGAQYLELSSDAERVADHLINVAKTIKKL